MPAAARWLVRLVAVGIALLAAVVLSPVPVAWAHAVFVTATPGPGADLRVAPSSVRMSFSEPLDAALSGIDVYGSSGRRVPARSGGVDPGDPRTYDVGLPQLRPDRYAVVWHTVSQIDGHSRRGSYSFTVDRSDGSPPRIHAGVVPSGPATPQVPTSAQAAFTWLGLAGLFLLTGAVLVVALGSATPQVEAARMRRWLRRLVAAGALGLLAGTLGELVSAWAATGWTGASLGSILISRVGRWWGIRTAAVAGVVLAHPWSARPAGPPSTRLLPAAGVGVIVWSFATTAHGAASPRARLGVGYEFVHILAASVWLGGAVAVALAWAVLRQEGAGDRRALVRRFSLVAGVAVPAVLATGFGNAVLELGSVDDLVTSGYGVSLLAKLALVVVLLGIAAVNAVVLRPAAAAGLQRGRRLGRTIAIEAAVGLAVLVPTAVMGVLAPSGAVDRARAQAQRIEAQSDPARAFTASTEITGRGAEITVTPGAVGVNAIHVEVDGTYAVAELHLSLAGPGGARSTGLARSGHDHDPDIHTIYTGSVQLDRSGTWQAVVASRGGSALSAPVVMSVSATAGAATSSEGNAGLTAWLGLIAVFGLCAVIAAAARSVPSGRRRVGVLAVGAAGAAVAAAWAGTLALGATGPAARPAAWGRARTVEPVQFADAKVWRVPTPHAGLMMPAIGADGSAWVAEMAADKLARVDPQGNIVQEFQIPGAYHETMGVAVAGDGGVWLAQEHAMALGRFDPATGHYREFPIPGGASAPVGIAVGAGKVWFTEMSGDRIGMFDPDTAKFRTFPVPTAKALPYWLALAPDGRVWFTEFGAGKVGELDPASGRIREFAVPGDPSVPGIAVGQDGSVWCTSIQGSLFRLTPSTGRIRRIDLPAAGDYGVAVGPDGRVWIGRSGGRTMYAFRPDTGAVRIYRLPPHSAPWWPVVDRWGHVWVSLAGDADNALAEVHRTS